VKFKFSEEHASMLKILKLIDSAEQSIGVIEGWNFGLIKPNHTWALLVCLEKMTLYFVL
jgi:hypothetical protein